MRRIGWLTLLLVLLAAPPAKGEQVIANFVPTYQYPHSLSWDGASLWVQENGPTIHRHDPLTGRELWTFTPDLSRFISSTAIACDGIHVWGCNWPELQIAELDPVDGHVLHLLGLHSPDGVGGAPTGLVWKDGALWMLTTGPNTICRVDPSTGEITSVLQLPGYSYVAALAWDGRAFWVASKDAGVLLQVDPQTGSFIGSVPAPCDDPTGLAWDGHFLWVAGQSLYKLDLQGEPYEAMQVVRSLLWSTSNQYYDVDWQDGLLWLSGQELDLVNPDSSGRPLRALGVPIGPGSTGIAYDGQHLWSANRFFQALCCVDPVQGTLLNVFPSADRTPMGMTYDGRQLWVADLLDTALYVYSWPGAALERKVRSPGPSAGGVAWDGQSLWESDHFTRLLSRLDPENGSVEAEFRLPMVFPWGIAADRTHGTMWALDGGAGRTVELAFPGGATHILGWRAGEDGSTLVLSWNLTTDNPASTITVERRTSDETVFVPIGQAACGVGACTFVDTNPVPGLVSYYQLKVDELDGSSKHIGPLAVPYRLAYPAIGPPGSLGKLRAGAQPSPSFGEAVSIWAIGIPGQPVHVRLFDVRGRLVHSLELAEQESGVFRAVWDGAGSDGRRARPGIYFAELRGAGGDRATVRITLLR